MRSPLLAGCSLAVVVLLGAVLVECANLQIPMKVELCQEGCTGGPSALTGYKVSIWGCVDAQDGSFTVAGSAAVGIKGDVDSTGVVSQTSNTCGIETRYCTFTSTFACKATVLDGTGAVSPFYDTVDLFPGQSLQNYAVSAACGVGQSCTTTPCSTQTVCYSSLPSGSTYAVEFKPKAGTCSCSEGCITCENPPDVKRICPAIGGETAWGYFCPAAKTTETQTGPVSYSFRTNDLTPSFTWSQPTLAAAAGIKIERWGSMLKWPLPLSGKNCIEGLLYAGQYNLVGTVKATVSKEGDKYKLEFEFNTAGSNSCLKAVHVHFGCGWPKTVSPGQFSFKDEKLASNTEKYTGTTRVACSDNSFLTIGLHAETVTCANSQCGGRRLAL